MLKLRIKKMYKNAFTCLVFLYSFSLFSEINIDPGEIFFIKVADCPEIKTREELFINFEGIEYAILPAPFSKEELTLNDYCLPVKVKKKKFKNFYNMAKSIFFSDLMQMLHPSRQASSYSYSFKDVGVKYVCGK